MLKQYFDFQLASYENLDEVLLDEVEQADLIEIRGHVEGGIYHPNQMQWVGSLAGVTAPEQMVRSKKERKALVENKTWFEDKGYRFEIKKVNIQLFNEFYDLYQQTTLNRERPLTFSLKEQILGKVFIEMPVYLIGMFKDDVLESGLVFSVSDDGQATVSFGAKKKFPERRGGVGGVFEYMLIEYCLEHGITQISHGKSRNPSGITSKAGIFEFKARYGFSAFPQGYWKTTFIRNPDIALSELVFIALLDGQVGYLVVSDNNPAEVEKKYQTKEVKVLKQISKNDLLVAATNFIESVKMKTTLQAE